MKSLKVACSAVTHNLKDMLSKHNPWTEVTTLLFSCWAASQLFCDPVDGSPPGSSDHGTSQVRTPGWVPFPPDPGLETNPVLAGGFLTTVHLNSPNLNWSNLMRLNCAHFHYRKWGPWLCRLLYLVFEGHYLWFIIDYDHEKYSRNKENDKS